MGKYSQRIKSKVVSDAEYKKVMQSKLIYLMFCIIYCIMFILSTIHVYSDFQSGYNVLKILFIVVAPPTFASLFTFLFVEVYKLKANAKYLIYIVLIMIISFLPLLTQPFLYHDDLENFSGQPRNDIVGGLGTSRPLSSATGFALSGLSYDDSYIGRIYVTCFIALFALLLFIWMHKKSSSVKISFFLTCCICCGVVAGDLIGYLSINPFSRGLVFASLSIMLFYSSFEYKQRHKLVQILMILFSILSLYFAFNMYAISTPIIFLFIAIDLYYNKEIKNRFIRIFQYAAIFLSTGILYVVSTKVLQNLYGIVGQAERGNFISTADQIFDKLNWFIGIVVPQSINRIIAVFTGGIFFKGNNLFYTLTYENNILGFILLGLSFLIICLAIFFFCYKKKNIFPTILLVLFIPASVAPLLILPESTYITYYAFPLIALLFFYFTAGFISFTKFIFSKHQAILNFLRKTSVMIVVIAILSINSNNYTNNFWVKYNQVSYESIRNFVSINLDFIEETKWIHVYGVAAPIQANAYSTFIVRASLVDLGLNPDEYKITCSDNENYINTITQPDTKIIIEKSNQLEIEVFNKYYKVDKYYNGSSYLSTYSINSDDLAILKQMFEKAGVLPSSEEAFTIDFSFIRQFYEF